MTEQITRIAAAIGGEHRVPIYGTSGQQIGWMTTYITGPQAAVLAAAVVAELGDPSGQTVEVVVKNESGHEIQRKLLEVKRQSGKQLS